MDQKRSLGTEMLGAPTATKEKAVAAVVVIIIIIIIMHVFSVRTK